MAQKIIIDTYNIEEADQSNSQSCMVSNAVWEQLDLNADRVYINTFYEEFQIVNADTDQIILSVPIDSATGKKIQAFDESKGKVKPFTFELDLPIDWREKVKAATS